MHPPYITVGQATPVPFFSMSGSDPVSTEEFPWYLILQLAGSAAGAECRDFCLRGTGHERS